MQYYFKGKNQQLYTQDMNVHVSDNNIQDIVILVLTLFLLRSVIMQLILFMHVIKKVMCKLKTY